MAGRCRSLGHFRELLRRLLRISSLPQSCDSVCAAVTVLLRLADTTLGTLIADGTHLQYLSPQPRQDHPHGRRKLATAPLRVYTLLCCVGARYATICTHRTRQKHHCSLRIHLCYILVRDRLLRREVHSQCLFVSVLKSCRNCGIGGRP